MMVYYYYVCKRKLWYFYNNITMEHNSENVKIGKILDENTYPRDEKHITIDNLINIDFLRNSKTLHEVKKSRAIDEASVWQLKYYIFYLKQRGAEGFDGKIDYPLLKQTNKVILDEIDEKEIQEMMDDLLVTVNQTLPPCVEKNKKCYKCAYYSLCFI